MQLLIVEMLCSSMRSVFYIPLNPPTNAISTTNTLTYSQPPQTTYQATNYYHIPPSLPLFLFSFTTIPTSPHPVLCPTINLINNVILGPHIPRPTVLLHVMRNMHALDRFGSDDQRREEAAGRVPGDVAVEGPDACCRHAR